MDAIEFVKEYKRIIKKYCPTTDEANCCPCPDNCPLYGQVCVIDLSHIDYISIQQLVNTVERWSKENPKKTMLQDFFERFPDAPRDRNGAPKCCPYECGYIDNNKCFGANCFLCWNRTIE